MLGWAQNKFRLARYRHGWGVACGLDVRCDPAPQHTARVIVGPGYAVDCCGDDIIVCQDEVVDLSGVCSNVKDKCEEWWKTTDPNAPDVVVGPHSIKADKARIVDLYIRYAEESSEPQLVVGASACKGSGTCEPTRTRESFVITWQPVAAGGGDPMTATAANWRKAYDKCSEVLGKFTAQFPKLSVADGQQVKNWLLCWIKDHPLHQFCFLRDQIDEMEDVSFKDAKTVTGLLFWIIQDCRNAFLSGACFGCEENQGVPLARIYLEINDQPNKPPCNVVAIDSYPPHRRPLRQEGWPAPLGKVNLSRFIWHCWEEVCRELDDLGVHISGTTQFVIPSTLEDLEEALSCEPFVSCAEEWKGNTRVSQALVVELFDFNGHCQRVIGICPPKQRTEPATQPGVSVTKTSKQESAKPGDVVRYEIVLTNTGNTLVTVKVEDIALNKTIVLGSNLTLSPGESRSFLAETPVPPGVSIKELTNRVLVTGTSPDGQSVKTETSHTMPITPATETKPGVTVTKSSKQDKAVPGKLVNYTITVANTGNVEVTLKVEDTILGKTTVLFDGLSLAPGETRSFDPEFLVPANIPDKELTNRVLVTGMSADGKPVKAVASHTFPVGPVTTPNIAVNMTSSLTRVLPNEEVTFKTTVANTGDTDLTMDVEEKFDGKIELLAESLVLPPGADRVFERSFKPDQARLGTRLVRQVSAVGMTNDGKTVSDDASLDIPVVAKVTRLTDIHNIGPASEEVLKNAGILFAEDLADVPLAKLKELFPKASEGRLNEWIQDSKNLPQ
ncbi:MAG: hypothetical protein JST85_15815 [Acidobacteria bacterium]|nr:hypothetical protein [Acidobacteriota bacterium]